MPTVIVNLDSFALAVRDPSLPTVTSLIRKRQDFSCIGHKTSLTVLVDLGTFQVQVAGGVDDDLARPIERQVAPLNRDLAVAL